MFKLFRFSRRYFDFLPLSIAVLAIMITGALISATSASASNKLAFVIGINAYPNLGSDAQLQRAVNDADTVGDTFQSLGFTVTRVTKDPTLNNILAHFGTFVSSISPGDTVAFFYAGHGLSMDDGTYLLPSDVPALTPADESLAKHAAVAEKEFSAQIQAAGARVALVVIDACRDNPFPKRGTRTIGSSTRGLSRLTPTQGTFTLYSAREGQTALDRLSDNDPSRNSVFTRVFAEELKKPGVNLSELGETVRDEVAALALTARHEQVPAVYNDMVGARSVFLSAHESPSADLQQIAAPSNQKKESQKEDVSSGEGFWSGLFGSGHKKEDKRSENFAPTQQVAMTHSAPLNMLRPEAIRECDKLAASPLDRERSLDIAGVDIEHVDVQNAISICREALKENPDNQHVMFTLARALNVDKQYEEAAKFYRVAVDKGNALAANNLATLFANGQGVQKNQAEALQLYQTAARAGVVIAMNSVAEIYASGNGVEKNEKEAIRFYRMAADSGNADALQKLGWMYANGHGVERDEVEAIKLYRQAVNGGSAVATRLLGYMYENGRGVPQDEAEAIKLYRQAVASGESDAEVNLGRMYATGRGVIKDETEAVRLYRDASDAGNARAMDLLAGMYANGSGLARDDGEAIKLYRKAADSGYAGAIENLGWMYANGRGVIKDDVEAVRLYRLAIDNGDVGAARLLGFMCENGRGISTNFSEALRLYHQAADVGDTDAMTNLGAMYEAGRGVAKDDLEAVRLYRKAGDAGNSRAQRYLGEMYVEGDGVAKDDAEAVRLFRRAAASGDAGSLTALGTMYATGRGVAKDDVEALRLFRKAVDAGETQAMLKLGIMYDDGRGTTKDESEAFRMYAKAADNGNTDAMIELGYMFQKGRGGLRRDLSAAKQWFKKAADFGNENAKKAMAKLH